MITTATDIRAFEFGDQPPFERVRPPSRNNARRHRWTYARGGRRSAARCNGRHRRRNRRYGL